MKKFVFFAAVALLAMAFTASAQKAPADFSGKWNLDLAKSKLSDREKAAIESQTITVTQTAADIKIETDTKRIAPAGGAAAPAGGRPAGGGGGAPMPVTYTLGKETTVEQTRGQMTIPVTSGGKWDGSKLVLTSSSVFQGPNGEVKQSSKEVWELGADGKSLTVTRESTGMQGTTTTTKVFTKG